MTTIGSPAGPLGRLEGLARGGGEGEGRCRLSSPPPKGATPRDRPPRGGHPNTTSSGRGRLFRIYGRVISLGYGACRRCGPSRCRQALRDIALTVSRDTDLLDRDDHALGSRLRPGVLLAGHGLGACPGDERDRKLGGVDLPVPDQTAQGWGKGEPLGYRLIPPGVALVRGGRVLGTEERQRVHVVRTLVRRLGVLREAEIDL